MSSRAASEERGSPWWVRLQRAIGLVPLAAFAGFHLWVQWPALQSREAWLARVRAYPPVSWLGASVLALFALHGLLGLARTLRETRTPDARAPGRGGLQSLTGLLLAVFLGYHLSHVWPTGALSGWTDASWLQSHQELWQRLGRPLPLALYVLGSGALACHVAQGFANLFEPLLPVTLRGALRFVTGLAGLFLFGLYMQLVGKFALGEALIPLARPTGAEVRGADETGQR
jgi:succinate dehydrogenase/fumarate reductase cytochrome b subunit